MSAGWLDVGNAPMVEWGLEAADVYGGVVFVDLEARFARVAVTADYELFAPVSSIGTIDVLLSTLAC